MSIFMRLMSDVHHETRLAKHGIIRQSAMMLDYKARSAGAITLWRAMI
jgi:hypothetical protein